MPLTLFQKSNLRRHLQYPAIGLLNISPGAGTLGSASAGWRFFEAYGFLEYKLNNLNPDEEARLTGNAFGAIAIIGPQPAPGDQITVTLSGGPIATPQILTATAQGSNSGYDNRLALANDLAGACSVNAVLQAAGVYSASPYGTGAFSQNAVAMPEVAFVASTSFTMTTSGTGVLHPQVTANGTQLPPSTSLDGGKTTVWGYLNILDGLEFAHAAASDNLDTQKADVWEGRSNEIGQRTSLYNMWQQMLSNFLQIPINPMSNRYPKSVRALSFA